MTDDRPHGRIAQLAQALHHHLPLAAATTGALQAPHEVYQYSTLEALLGGVYDGDVTIGELLTHGDFGLGTFNSLDGEMIILDGVCYHLRSDGTAAVSAQSELTPFAAVTYFRPRTTFAVDTPTTYQHLDDLVSAQISSHNLNYAIRVTGQFSTVRTRTVARQNKPYPPLTEATEGQAEATFTDIAGTLAGYLSPSYEQGITVAGYHLHFLDDSRTHGGHCLDFTLTEGTVEIDTISDLHLSLPQSGAFLTAAMPPGGAVDEQIRKAEGGG
jgi:acetolactate decarboxylase